MPERRKQSRIPVHHLMEARLIAKDRETLAQVLDLNNAGAFVATDLAIEVRAELQVELQIPGIEKSLPLKAIVARRTSAIEGKHQTIPAGLGLVFQTENVLERAFIQRAVLEALRSGLRIREKAVSPPSPPA